MANLDLTNPKTLIFAPLILLLLFAVACGGTAATSDTPVPGDQGTAREAPVEVAKEVPTVAAPTSAPAAIKEEIRRGGSSS